MIVPIIFFFFLQGELEHMQFKQREQPQKVLRDVQSYEVECAFYASHAARSLATSGNVYIPTCYEAELLPCREMPIESKFSLLLEDLSRTMGNWQQERMLSHLQATSALKALARMHAFFLPGSFYRCEIKNDEELRRILWKSGGYWQPIMQPGQMDILESAWDKHLTNFGDTFSKNSYLSSVDLPSLGRRLQRHAAQIGAEAHPFSGCDGTDEIMSSSLGSRLRALETVIHGEHETCPVLSSIINCGLFSLSTSRMTNFALRTSSYEN